MKILMVCLGNICRSPLAEAIMQSKLCDCGIEFHVDSAGTGSWHVGQLPDQRSIKVAGKYGIDITGQRARQFHVRDFEEFDLIFTMDEEIHSAVLSKAKSDSHRKKVHLLLTYAGHDSSLVPDPYYDDHEAFEEVYWLLDDACNKVKDKLLKKD